MSLVQPRSLIRIAFACFSPALLAFCGCGGGEPAPVASGTAATAATSAVAATATGTHSVQPASTSTAALQVGEKPIDLAGLHRVMHVAGDIYSGSEPHGEEGFATLAKLGVKTLVSVDGAQPDVELARKHGLRYIHIPIGYDGFEDDDRAAFARVATDVEGPVYVHCHHGQHRGPAGAAAICVAKKLIAAAEAPRVLERAETGKNYGGLWRDVGSYTPPGPDTPRPKLVEVAEVGSLAAAMADCDRHFDNLKLCRPLGWSVPPDHPDVLPVHEALLVKESLVETARLTKDRFDAPFHEILAVSIRHATSFEEQLAAGEHAAATATFTLLDTSCKACHGKYRNARP